MKYFEEPHTMGDVKEKYDLELGPVIKLI